MNVLVLVSFRIVLQRMSWHAPAPDPAMSDPALTVIIPARNEEQDLEQSLRSVLSQPGIDLRVIVINDHSTDRTGLIADQMAAADPRITVIHNPELRP